MSYSRFAYLIAWVWVFLLLEADLKISLHPQIHWAITGLALCLVFPRLMQSRLRFGHHIQWQVVFLAGWFATSVLITSLPTEAALYGLVQTLKLVAILVLAFPLLLAQPRLAHVGFEAAHAAVWANLGLLLLGATISPVFASVMAGDDRWGTFFNYPGSLWRVGTMVLVFSAYALCWRRSVYMWLLFASSLCLVYFDGSRTAALVVVLATLFVGWILVNERRGRRIVIPVLAAVCVCGTLLLGSLLGSESMGSILPARVADAFGEYVSGGFEDVDIERVQMIQAAWRRIVEQPLWGTGIGTTRAEGNEGLLVVHNSYLQAWADLGPLGVVAFAGLAWGWLLWLPRFLANVRQQANPMLRAVYYNAAFLLLIFAFSGLFHPLSTEWSEWVTFMVPYALFVEGLRMPYIYDETRFQRSYRYS